MQVTRVARRTAPSAWPDAADASVVCDTALSLPGNYQIRTRSSGSSHSASLGWTSNAV